MEIHGGFRDVSDRTESALVSEFVTADEAVVDRDVELVTGAVSVVPSAFFFVDTLCFVTGVVFD